ncbi:hypothetical protein V8F20_010195 [Naviculisporaceae sp. PSN 640]
MALGKVYLFILPIDLGLGYPSYVLGRANSYGEYVKHRKDKADIKVELQWKPGEARNYVVGLTIRWEDSNREDSNWEDSNREDSNREPGAGSREPGAGRITYYNKFPLNSVYSGTQFQYYWYYYGYSRMQILFLLNALSLVFNTQLGLELGVILVRRGYKGCVKAVLIREKGPLL